MGRCILEILVKNLKLSLSCICPHWVFGSVELSNLTVKVNRSNSNKSDYLHSKQIKFFLYDTKICLKNTFQHFTTNDNSLKCLRYISLSFLNLNFVLS